MYILQWIFFCIKSLGMSLGQAILDDYRVSPWDSRITCIFNWKVKTRAWDTGVPLLIFYLWVNILSRYFLGLKHCSYPERNMWFNIYSGKSLNWYRRYFSKDNPLTYIKVMKICRKFISFLCIVKKSSLHLIFKRNLLSGKIINNDDIYTLVLALLKAV